MNKKLNEGSKDLLWGLFWVGMVVGSVVYTVLHGEKGERLRTSRIPSED